LLSKTEEAIVSEEKFERVALITGGAKRTGAAIAKRLHIHYRASKDDAQSLAATLNAIRANSAAIFQADLLNIESIAPMVAQVVQHFGRLDAFVNNASTFYGGALESVDENAWSELVGSNLKAPIFLCKAAAPHLQKTEGSIVNITDIHAERPMKNYVLYNVAKAGLRGLTHALAIDLAPHIRVNAIAPGPIVWPDDNQISAAEKARIIDHVPLKREGGFEQIAEATKYLICDANFVTGQTINVDGGRHIAL
jgi:pteridine reductase